MSLRQQKVKPLTHLLGGDARRKTVLFGYKSLLQYLKDRFSVTILYMCLVKMSIFIKYLGPLIYSSCSPAPLNNVSNSFHYLHPVKLNFHFGSYLIVYFIITYIPTVVFQICLFSSSNFFFPFSLCPTSGSPPQPIMFRIGKVLHQYQPNFAYKVPY